MNILKQEELKKISGGGLNFAVGGLIISGIIFLIGVIDGYTRPLKCN